MDSHTTGPGVQDLVGAVLSTELPTDCHHNSIESSVRWCVWQVGKSKMGSYVFQCDVPRQWIAQRQLGPVSIL